MNPFNFLGKESNFEITLKNGKKMNCKGTLTTTFNWAIIENNKTTISINRNELILIKETKGEQK